MDSNSGKYLAKCTYLKVSKYSHEQCLIRVSSSSIKRLLTASKTLATSYFTAVAAAGAAVSLPDVAAAAFCI